MTRAAWLGLCGVVGGGALAVAEPAPTLDAATEKKLAKAGWKEPALLLERSGLRVVSARKARKRHVLMITGNATIVDGGLVPGTGHESATVADAGLLLDLTPVQLGYQTTRGNGASETTSWIWLVRPTGAVACRLEGGSSRNPGTACGSGGLTRVELATSGDDGLSVEVTTEHTGTWSESDGKGGCIARSPVRSGPLRTRYRIPERGMCSQITK